MKYRDKDWLYQKYCVEKRTLRDIAKECNSSFSAINYWLIKYNIPKRTTYESYIWNNTGICVITDFMKDFIDGELLGDASMHTQGGKTAYFQYGSKYEEYIKYLIDVFCSHNISYIGNVRKSYKGEGKRGSLYTYCLTTKSYPEFKNFHDRFYKEHTKIVPQDINFSPVMIRQWFIGDGSLIHRKTRKSRPIVKLCTHSFSQMEVNFLVEKLNEILNIECWARKDKIKDPYRGYYIVIPYRNLDNFFKYID